MQIEDFIISAYAITIVFISAMCLTTWHSARATKRRLNEKTKQ